MLRLQKKAIYFYGSGFVSHLSWHVPATPVLYNHLADLLSSALGRLDHKLPEKQVRE